MEDIFQYIVIIGAIIVAIVKNVSKEKPKTATTPRQSPVVTTIPENEKQTSPSSEWEKWLNSETETEPMKQEPLIVAPAHQDVHSLSSSIKRRPTIQVEEIKALKNTEHTDHAPQIALDSMDEIRKAIIYSEIIQRKY